MCIRLFMSVRSCALAFLIITFYLPGFDLEVDTEMLLDEQRLMHCTEFVDSILRRSDQ